MESRHPTEPPPPSGRRITAAATQEPTSILDASDDLLRLILLRLDSPLWLVRAACACRQFRRAVVSGGRAFLRLAASLHPPAVVGYYDSDRRGHERLEFVPWSPTTPPLAPAHFSLDFLTQHLTTTISDWEVADCHGGLVLLLRSRSDSTLDLIVCDPLMRRHKRIRRPPHEKLPASHYYVDTFLLDGDGGDDITVSNFRVLYRYGRSYHGIHACMFNTDGDGWCFLKRPADDDYYYTGHVVGRVDGAIYLGLTTGNINVLDSTSLKVSKVDMPIRVDTSYTSRFTVVHGAGPDPSSPSSTWIIHVRGVELEFFRLVRRCGGVGEWVLEHTIPHLLEATRKLRGGPSKKALWLAKVDVIANGTGTAVLSAWATDGRTRVRYKRRWFFSIAMDTKELQVLSKWET